MSTLIERLRRFTRRKNLVLDPVLRPIAGGAPVDIVVPQFMLAHGGYPVQDGDYLVVRHGYVTTGSSLTLTVRMLTEQGDILNSTYLISVSAGAFAEYETPLPDGILLSVCLSPSDAIYQPGSEYALVGIKSQSLDGVQPFMALCSGYVSKLNPIAWPSWNQNHDRVGPGQVRELLSNDPAAGSTITITVSADTDIRFISGRIYLTTSATAADRLVFIRVTTGGQVVAEYFAQAVQAASLTYTYSIGAYHPSVGLAGTRVNFPIPDNFWIEGGSTIFISCDNLQAGDDFSSLVYQTEEWIRAENF